MVGGQSFGLDTERYLAVDGIEEVIRVLDKMELGKLPEIDFLKAMHVLQVVQVVF